MLCLPLLSLRGGDTLDVLLGVDGLLAAVDVEEVLAAIGDVQGLLKACGIAEAALGVLGYEGRSLGVVLDLANDLLLGGFFLYLQNFSTSLTAPRRIEFDRTSIP